MSSQLKNFNGTDKRYNQFSAHLKNKFGVKVYKITLDAGFSCPNRDGKISTGGCIFCDDSGSFSQAHSKFLQIEEQVETGVENLMNCQYCAVKWCAILRKKIEFYDILEGFDAFSGEDND